MVATDVEVKQAKAKKQALQALKVPPSKPGATNGRLLPDRAGLPVELDCQHPEDESRPNRYQRRCHHLHFSLQGQKDEQQAPANSGQNIELAGLEH